MKPHQNMSEMRKYFVRNWHQFIDVSIYFFNV